MKTATQNQKSETDVLSDYRDLNAKSSGSQETPGATHLFLNME